MENEAQMIRVGVGAVVFRGEQVLLIRRGKPPFAGLWSIPGGGLNPGERLEAAVRREVKEETSVEIGPLSLIGIFEALPADLPAIARHTVLVDYVGEWLSGEPQAGDDAERAEFVDYDEALRRVSWDQTRLAIAQALKLRNSVTERP